MKIKDFVKHLNDCDENQKEKMVIVDATEKEGRLIAAFLMSNLGHDQVFVVLNTNQNRAED